MRCILSFVLFLLVILLLYAVTYSPYKSCDLNSNIFLLFLSLPLPSVGMWIGQVFSYERWRFEGRIWAMPFPVGEEEKQRSREKAKKEENHGKKKYNYLTPADCFTGQSRGVLASFLGVMTGLLPHIYSAAPLVSLLFTIGMNATYAGTF